MLRIGGHFSSGHPIMLGSCGEEGSFRCWLRVNVSNVPDVAQGRLFSSVMSELIRMRRVVLSLHPEHKPEVGNTPPDRSQKRHRRRATRSQPRLKPGLKVRNRVE